MADKEKMQNTNEVQGDEKEITALDSFRQIMKVLNRHRLIVPSDFDEETFIPDL